MESENLKYLKLVNLLLLLENQLTNKSFFSTLKEVSQTFPNLDSSIINSNEEEKNKFLEFIEKGTENSATIRSLQPVKHKRIYIDGCFDLMHSGHFNAIRQAKQLTEVLVVGVISDQAIEQNKGPCIMELKERAALVRACKWVDEVVEGVDYNPTIELIDRENCSHSVHGDDLAIAADGKDSYYEIKKANRIITEGISTTDVVGRLLLLTKEHHQIQETRSLRKMSGDHGVKASEITEEKREAKPETKKDEYIQNLPKVKLMNTTRRIRQFSSTRESKPDDIIVYVDGSFDILRKILIYNFTDLGHLEILKTARELGTFVLVGLHDDENVDEVVIGAPWKISENMIKNFNISIVIESKIISEDKKEIDSEDDPYEIPKKLGIYKSIAMKFKLSIEDIVNKIVKNRIRYLEAQKKKETKLQNYYKTENFGVKEVFAKENKND